MPESVRLFHLVETGSSTFVFKLVTGAVLVRAGERRAGEAGRSPSR